MLVPEGTKIQKQQNIILYWPDVEGRDSEAEKRKGRSMAGVIACFASSVDLRSVRQSMSRSPAAGADGDEGNRGGH